MRSSPTQYHVAAMTLKRARGQDLPRREHRVAHDSVGPGAETRTRPASAATTSCGRATSTRSRPRRSPLGDADAANRSLDYLFDVQQKPDGSFPQNSLLDGTPYWGGLQLDEVAFPIVLAWQLGRTDPRPTPST